MADVNDLHRFYESNVPGYERRDLVRVNRFFVEQMGIISKKPIKDALARLNQLKPFVAFDWYGWDAIGTKKLPPEETIVHNPTKKKKEVLEPCGCGGHLIKRQNSVDKSFFWGCSRYPKCTKTKPFLE